MLLNLEEWCVVFKTSSSKKIFQCVYKHQFTNMFITQPTTGTVIISWIQTYIGELQSKTFYSRKIHNLLEHLDSYKKKCRWSTLQQGKKTISSNIYHSGYWTDGSQGHFRKYSISKLWKHRNEHLGRTKGNYMRSKKGKKEGYSGRLGKVYTCTGRHSWSCNSITNQHSCWACKESQ